MSADAAFFLLELMCIKCNHTLLYDCTPPLLFAAGVVLQSGCSAGRLPPQHLCTQNYKSQTLRNGQTPTAMYLPSCLNVAIYPFHLFYGVFVMSSLLCALPHTILPCRHISISSFYIPCLLPVLRSFAQ
jgi:hypothetical protein